MASNATIFKAALQIADVDRHYYQDHALTLARHPSETDERMMVRLLAFALHAHDALSFGRGLSTEDEPDLWQKDLTGVIELWPASILMAVVALTSGGRTTGLRSSGCPI